MEVIPSPTLPLDELTTPRQLEPGRFENTIPDGWQQGRGAFGGLVLATLTRAAEAHAGDPERALRSMTAELVGPTLPGPASILVETLRAGKSVTTIAARLVQSGEVQAHAVLVLGRSRPDAAVTHVRKPTMPPPNDVAPTDMDSPFYPAFAKHYEFRNVGPFPFSGAPHPSASGWVKPRNPGAKCDAAWVVACADGWWPASFSVDTVPRPMATIAYTLELVGSLEGLDPRDPVFHVGNVECARDGYVVETRAIWSKGGSLLALNHQTFVVIR